jgi:RNA polymerase sigma factor (sigma-70 family)
MVPFLHVHPSRPLAAEHFMPGAAIHAGSPRRLAESLVTIALVEAEAGATAAGAAAGSVPTRSDIDRRLAARLMAGDPDALAQAYAEFGGLVLGISQRVLRDDRMAEDVTQEVFAFLWEHPERYDPARGGLRSWLGLLAHRRSVDRVRTESRRARVEALADAPGNEEAEGDERLTREWISSRVRIALERLPAKQREVLELAYFGGRSYRQVADDLALPEGTVKSRVRMALNRMHDLLSAQITEEELPAWI